MLCLQPHRRRFANSSRQSQVRQDAKQSLTLITSKKGKGFSSNGIGPLMLKLYDHAGLDWTSSHSTRRTLITALAHKGVNVRVPATLAENRSEAASRLMSSISWRIGKIMRRRLLISLVENTENHRLNKVSQLHQLTCSSRMLSSQLH